MNQENTDLCASTFKTRLIGWSFLAFNCRCPAIRDTGAAGFQKKVLVISVSRDMFAVVARHGLRCLITGDPTPEEDQKAGDDMARSEDLNLYLLRTSGISEATHIRR